MSASYLFAFLLDENAMHLKANFPAKRTKTAADLGLLGDDDDRVIDVSLDTNRIIVTSNRDDHVERYRKRIRAGLIATYDRGVRGMTNMTCTNCHGQGRIKCHGFCRAGRLTCPVCGGHGCSTCSHTGTIACATCGGRGDIVCGTCGGSGSIRAN